MKHLKNVVIGISKAGNIICIVSIITMMCFVTAEVILRTLFNSPIPGLTELTQCCWIIMALSFGMVAIEDGNVKVDFFVIKINPHIRRVLILIVDLITVAYCFIIGWRTIIKCLSSKNANIMYVMLGTKEWPFMLIFAISFFLAGIAAILVTINEWNKNSNACKENNKNEDKRQDGCEEVQS